jgi:hypothetical protein
VVDHREAVFEPFLDERDVSERLNARKTSWLKGRGRVDYFGEDVGRGLAAHAAEYLAGSRVFSDTQSIEFMYTRDALARLGFDAILRARLTEFRASFEVPKWTLVLAILPIPTGGLTLLPITLWPKQIEFRAVLESVTLEDIQSGSVLWKGSVEIREDARKTTHHFFPKWFLGETAERVAKALVDSLSRADLG